MKYDTIIINEAFSHSKFFILLVISWDSPHQAARVQKMEFYDNRMLNNNNLNFTNEFVTK